MSGPQNSFKPHIEPTNSSLGSKKVKKQPKIKPNSNVRIEGNKENPVVHLDLDFDLGFVKIKVVRLDE